MLGSPIDHIGFGMGARIYDATVAVERENVCRAALGPDRQPPRVTRKADVPDLGRRVAAIQRVQVLDNCARALVRVGVDLEDVEVLAETVGREQEPPAVVELQRVDGLLVGEEVGDDPALVLVVQQLGLARIADVLLGVQDGANAWLQVLLAVVAVLCAVAAGTVVAAWAAAAVALGFGHCVRHGFAYFHQALGNTLNWARSFENRALLLWAAHSHFNR